MCQTFPSVPSLRAICEFLLFLLYLIIIIHYRLVIRSSLVIRLMLLMSSLLMMISTFYQLVEMIHGWLMCVSVYSTTVHYACSAWSKKSAWWIREFCVCVRSNKFCHTKIIWYYHTKDLLSFIPVLFTIVSLSGAVATETL